MNDTFLMNSWDKSRRVIHDIVDNPFFEWTILLLIFASRLGIARVIMIVRVLGIAGDSYM